MKPIAIFGTGEHAECVHFYLANDSEHEVEAFTVDRSAPINISELMKDEYVRYITSGSKLKEYGVFNRNSTEKLLEAVSLKESHNERDCMLYMGILTTQILYDQFIA